MLFRSIFFEKALIKYLFIDDKKREKIAPFLHEKYFNDKNNMNIVKYILEFETKYNKFPIIAEMKLFINDKNTYDALLEIMDLDLSQYTDEFLIEETEEFFKKQMISDINVEIVDTLNNKDLNSVIKAIDKLRESCSFSFNTAIGLDFLNDTEREFEFLHNRDNVIPTGIKTLDNLIEGGVHVKSLTLFIAPINHGKSLILSSLATNALLNNKKVLYITLEMSEDKISERILANIFDIEMEQLKHISKEKFCSKMESIKNSIKGNLFIKEYPPSSINANNLRNLIKELKIKRKFEPDIVFLDYLGLMWPIHINKNNNTYNDLKKISEEIRAIGVETALPWVSCGQVNRGGLSSSDLDLDDMADSIGPGMTADLIIASTQTEDLRSNGKFCWTIIKNRYGINKKRFYVDVNYLKMRIYEAEDVITKIENVGKPIPPSQIEKDKIEDKAVDDVINIINKDTKDKFKNIIIE